MRSSRLCTVLPRSGLLPVVALVTLGVSTGAWEPVAGQDRPIEPRGRAVLITGATSGIGRLTTELLAQRGFFVYAGARSADDMAEQIGRAHV